MSRFTFEVNLGKWYNNAITFDCIVVLQHFQKKITKKYKVYPSKFLRKMKSYFKMFDSKIMVQVDWWQGTQFLCGLGQELLG